MGAKLFARAPAPVAMGQVDKLTELISSLSLVDGASANVDDDDGEEPQPPPAAARSHVQVPEAQPKQPAASPASLSKSAERAQRNAEVAARTEELMKSKLMEHQRTALTWMLDKEKSRFAGGCIADEMGMGKTVQVLSLVAATSMQPRKKGQEERGPTLIVCPAMLVGQWDDQIERHLHTENLSVHRYHGRRRAKSKEELASFDIVITTYATVQLDKDQLLAAVEWDRVVLDEAHNIRNHKSKTHQAVCDLQAKYRWMLTGTPLQNGVVDLFCIFKFLRITKFEDFDYFKSKIMSDHKGMKRLQCLLAKIMIRRTRDTKAEDGTPLVPLPERTFEEHWVQLDEYERRLYGKVKAHGAKLLSVAEGEQQSGQGVQLLMLALKLRQICAHHSLSKTMLPEEPLPDAIARAVAKLLPRGTPQQARQLTKTIQDNMFDSCALCRSAMDLPCALVCGHCICFECASSPEGAETCPTCKSPITSAKGLQFACIFGARLREGDMSNVKPMSSSKVRALVERLKALQQQEPGAKAVIFSQWTSMLDVVQTALQESRIAATRVDGTQTVEQREKNIAAFREPGIAAILISLKAGNAGLDLTEANHVFMVDIWWNPSVEDQAFDRVYRIGQKKRVTVHRLLVENSIEEKILKVQEEKRSMMKNALRGDPKQHMQLTKEELLQLFQ